MGFRREDREALEDRRSRGHGGADERGVEGPPPDVAARAPHHQEEGRAGCERPEGDQALAQRGGFREPLAVDGAKGQAVDDGPERARLRRGEERREAPEDEERLERRVGAGGVRPRLEVVDEPEGPARGETGEENDRPRRGLVAAGEAREQPRAREDQGEQASAPRPALGRCKREREGEAEKRQPVGHTGGKRNGERQPVTGERDEEEEDASERPRRPAAGGTPCLAHRLSDSFWGAIDPSPHPRWYS
jgi:hypothetical protein